MKLITYQTVAEFLAVAKGPLMREEARNNLILGIAGRLNDGITYGEPPPYFLTVELDGEFAAAAIRTPPHPLILHCEKNLPGVIQAIHDHLAAADPSLPGVNGEPNVAAGFAELWTASLGQQAIIDVHLRIYVLEEVSMPAGVPGRMRRASGEDLDVLAEWVGGFFAEAAPNDPPRDQKETVNRFMNSGTLVVWDDGGPVSMAGSSRGTDNGATVSLVYTPPEHRGQGYGSACTASLSQLLLDRGYSFCTLYTDLENPTSNKVYQRIGYRRICDATSYRFEGTGQQHL